MPDKSSRYSKASQEQADATLSASAISDRQGSLVYGLTDLATGEIRYVGRCANGLRYRLVRHFDHARRGETWAVADWIRRSSASIGVVILETDPDDPSAAEWRWILRLRGEGARLTNRLVITEQHKERIRQSNHRRFEDPEARRRIGDIWRGRKLPADVVEKMRVSRLGRRHSEESKAKMSAARKGVPKSEAMKANLRAYHARKRAQST